MRLNYNIKQNTNARSHENGFSNYRADNTSFLYIPTAASELSLKSYNRLSKLSLDIYNSIILVESW